MTVTGKMMMIRLALGHTLLIRPPRSTVYVPPASAPRSSGSTFPVCGLVTGTGTWCPSCVVYVSMHYTIQIAYYYPI